MLIAPHEPPIPFDPRDDRPEEGEAEVIQLLIETLRSIQEKTFEDGGHPLRALHAKSYGIFEGELQVLEDLAPDYAQGLFARAGARHRVVMRLSSIPGDTLDDEITLPRGLSLKVLDVDGARLPGSEADRTQDFVLVNGPKFVVPSAKAFLANLKLLAATTDRVEGLKKGLSQVNRIVEATLEAFGAESANLKTLGGAPMTHPLGDSFFSQGPLLYGDYVAKISVAPASADLQGLAGKSVDVKGKPDGFRELVRDHIVAHGGVWDVRVQLRTRRDEMPVDDPSKEWSTDHSPYLPVARIVVAPQDGWNAARSEAVDDGLAFSPWHGLAAHRPLGSVMRARQATYAASAAFRGARLGCPIHEPRSWEGLPD